MTKKNHLLFLSLILIFTNKLCFAQDIEFKRTSIRTGIGIGFNEGERETGIGLLYSIGWQKSYGEKNRIRLNPNMIIGGFAPIGITDTRDQFYRITSFGCNLHYDLIKYKSLSIVTTGGIFANYSRGLLGTGGDGDFTNNNSDYFNSFYFGGNISLGLRIDSHKKHLVYEIRPINAQIGNNYFTLAYFMLGIDFKFKN